MTHPHRLLKLGSAFELMLDLSDLSESERMEYVGPLRSTAKEILKHVLGDESESWHGPLTPGHEAAANIVLRPRLEDVLNDIPTSVDYIERYIPALFPRHLPQIYTRWAELVVHHEDYAKRLPSLMSADTWWKSKMSRVPLTQAVTLHLLSDWLDKAQLYALLVHKEDLAYHLIKAGFHTPAVGSRTMAEDRLNAYPPASTQHFLIPSLIRAGFITLDEVREWIEYAVNMPERSQEEVAWFTSLKESLTAREPQVLESTVDRWWLEPREQLLWANFNRDGVVDHSFDDPKVNKLVPALVLLHDGKDLTGKLTNLHRDGNTDVPSQAIDTFRSLGLEDAAERVEKAQAHVTSDYDFTKSEPMGDHPKVVKKTKKMNKKWKPLYDEAELTVSNKLRDLGWNV